MTITIRAAREEDAPFLAWAALTSTRSHLAMGWFDIVLARPEVECLAFLRQLACTPTRSWCHFSRALILEAEGRPAAALAAFSAQETWPLSERGLAEVSESSSISEDEQKAMSARGAYLFACIMGGDGDYWTIENVATWPGYRGRDFAPRLVEHALEAGRKRGYDEAQLTLLIGNDAAERAYAKLGFSVVEEKRHPDFEAATGAPGMQRMLAKL
jgi:translation initiation factor 4G